MCEFAKFDGSVEPTGWLRCMDQGKRFRRRVKGDPTQEYTDMNGAAPITVEHASLTPASDEANKLASICPACKLGVLGCTRAQGTLVLEEHDCCALCGQVVIYSDIDAMRAKDWAK